MKSVVVTAPGVLTTIDVPVPEIGPRDVLVAIRACGICGADPHALSEGGIPPLEQPTPLGHEPAGEIVEVGDAVEGLQVGDHVVIEPMGPTGIIGGGAEQGALSEFVRIAVSLCNHAVQLARHCFIHLCWPPSSGRRTACS